MLEEAESERAKAEQIAAEIVEAAQRRAEEVTEEARLDRDDADRAVVEARHQLERFTEEAEAAADGRVRAVMDGSMVHLEELRQELEQLEVLREDTLGELSRLRSSLENLRV